MQIVPSDRRTGLASACAPKTKIVGDLLCRADPPAHQDFKQELEARSLESQPLDAAAPDHEASRHRVSDSKLFLGNQRRRGERAQPGNSSTQHIPTFGSVIPGV